MTCTRSSSPTPPPAMINNKHKTNSLLSACCTCSRARKNTNIKAENGNILIENGKSDVHKGFFKRIQFFKGLKMSFRSDFFNLLLYSSSTKTSKFCS